MNLRHTLKWSLAAVVLGVGGYALSVGAQVQEPEFALVTSKGKGTVYTRPTHVVFRLHETVTGESMEASITSSYGLGEALRTFVAENELRPSSMEISDPAIVSIEGNLVRTTASLHFSTTPYAAGEAGAEKLGALCDLIAGFAKDRGCQLAKPDFVTTETAAVIQDAVVQATKDAYTAASGAATALGGSVSEVDSVEVETVTWNATSDTEEVFPTLERIACTAQVRLAYLVGFP